MASRHFSRASRVVFLAVALVVCVPATRADCECGYSAVIGDDVHVFTDLLETDFARLDDDDDLAANTDWQRQAFNVTAAQARGSYGEMFSVGNMRAATTERTDGVDAGLQLVVGASLVDGMVPVAEIDSSRADMLYGTFRASIKLTSVVGTCSAFFWYYNDTQEIDMEFLSREYTDTYPVNLVLQSRAAAESGFNAAGTPSFVRANLPFDPTAAFHEYRIDFLPDHVVFYADNTRLAAMDNTAGAVPSHAGHLVLQQWSNGNAAWSGGPPREDATTTVAYVKAYFNSSSAQRQNDWARRCGGDMGAAGAVCAIPEVTADNATASGWFFSDQGNMTGNQTVSGQDSAGSRLAGGWVCTVSAVSVSVLFLGILW